MLLKISELLTKYLIKKNIVPYRKTEVFIYGFQLTLSTLASMFTIIFITAFINITYGLIFLVFFMPIRFCAGGYHAPTYCKCFLYTNSVFVFDLLITNIVYSYNLLPYYMIIIVICVLYLWLNTPCLNNNNPLSESYIRKNKLNSHKILVLYFVIISITCHYNYFIVILELNTIFIVSILFIIGNFEYKRQTYNQLKGEKI